MGPVQRWITAVREVILRSVEERIVVFVDEIDYVRSLPFSTDEFFAGIRFRNVQRASMSTRRWAALHSASWVWLRRLT